MSSSVASCGVTMAATFADTSAQNSRSVAVVVVRTAPGEDRSTRRHGRGDDHGHDGRRAGAHRVSVARSHCHNPAVRCGHPSWDRPSRPSCHPPQLRAATAGGRRDRHRSFRNASRSAGSPRHRRGPRGHRPAGLLHRRPPRRSVPRIARPGARGVAEQRRRVAVVEADHRQPRPVEAPQDRIRPRSGDRGRACWWRARPSCPRSSRASASSASSGSTGRSAPYPVWRRWSACWATSTPSCRSTSADEAQVAALGHVRCVARLDELIDVLCGRAPWPEIDRRPFRPMIRRSPISPTFAASRWPAWRSRSPPLVVTTCCSSVRRALARRCSPQRLPGLLPPLERALALEATMVHSAAGVPLPPGGLVRRAPFRAPHHTQLDRRPGRRRLERPAAGRDQSRSRRRPLPRRARGVPRRRPRRRCVSRSRQGSSTWPARTCTSSCRPGSCSSRQPTRVRVVAAHRARASATKRRSSALPPPPLGPAARPVRPPRHGPAPRRRRRCSPAREVSRRRSIAVRVERARRLSLASGSGALNAELSRRAPRPVRAAHSLSRSVAPAHELERAAPHRARLPPHPARRPDARRPRARTAGSGRRWPRRSSPSRCARGCARRSPMGGSRDCRARRRLRGGPRRVPGDDDPSAARPPRPSPAVRGVRGRERHRGTHADPSPAC